MYWFVYFSVENTAFSELVVRCQELIREFALDKLNKFGIEEEEAILRSTSSVSQRDIQVCEIHMDNTVLLNSLFYGTESLHIL